MKMVGTPSRTANASHGLSFRRMRWIWRTEALAEGVGACRSPCSTCQTNGTVIWRAVSYWAPVDGVRKLETKGR